MKKLFINNAKRLKYNKFFVDFFSWALQFRRMAISFASGKKRKKEAFVYSNISSCIVSDVIVKPPNINGEFFISPKSHLLRVILSNGAYEPEIVRLFEKYILSDQDFLDIGANIGFYTIFSAKKMTTGRVIAVEPVKAAHDRLIKNIERNGVERFVSAIRCFVSNEKGITVIRSIPGMEEYSSASESNIQTHDLVQEFVTEQVDCLTLDEIVNKHQLNPGLIKIDVEGSEYKVLQGAQKCLEKFSPILIIECSDNLLRGMGSSSSEMIAYLENLGYCPLDPHTESKVSLRTGVEDNLLFIKA